ncbi:YncE family protein, partial [Acidianus sp. RZ1]|uniref:YncE family protein n=1 Tax=Acidianus sp. RZ1 TaxID=1540082 RepID=UPI0014930B85
LSLLDRDYLSVYPLSIAYDNVSDKVIVGLIGGIGILKGDNITDIVRMPGIVSSLAVNNIGNIYVVGYNLSANRGFFSILDNNFTVKLEDNFSTFFNFVSYINGKTYIGGDGCILIYQNSTFSKITYLGEDFYGMAYDPINDLVYVAAHSLYGPDFVLVIKGTNIVGRIYGVVTPIDIIFNPVSKLIFVSNFFSGTLSIISPGKPPEGNTQEVTLPSNSYVSSTSSMGINMLKIIIILTIALFFIASLFLRKLKRFG